MSEMARVKTAILKELLSQGGKCQCPVAEIYRKLRQNLPIIVLPDSEDTLRSSLKTCDKMFQLSSNEQVVSPITELTICSRHCKRSGSCTNTRCRDLHLCVFFLLSGQCQHADRCHFGHDLNTAHNRNVLQEHHLQDLNLTELRILFCLPTVRQGALVPNVCTYYNDHHGCSKSDSCKAFHVCKFYLNQNCKFGTSCIRNHDMQNAQVSKVLSMYGISTARPVSHLLEELRGLPLNKARTHDMSDDERFDDTSADRDAMGDSRNDDDGDDLSEGEVRSNDGKEGGRSPREPDPSDDRKDPSRSPPGQGREGRQTDFPKEILVPRKGRARQRHNFGQNDFTGPGIAQNRKASKRRRHSISPASGRGHGWPFDARDGPTSGNFNELDADKRNEQNAGHRNGSHFNGWNDPRPHHRNATFLYNSYSPSCHRNGSPLDERDYANPDQTKRSHLYDRNGSCASDRNGSPFYDRSNITPRSRSGSPNNWRTDGAQCYREPLPYDSRDEPCFGHRNEAQVYGRDDPMARRSSRTAEPPHGLGLKCREDSSSPRPRQKRHRRSKRRVFIESEDEAGVRNFETAPLPDDNTERYRDREYSGSSLRRFEDDRAEKSDVTNHLSFNSFHPSGSPSGAARRGQSPDWGRRGQSPDWGRRGQSPDWGQGGQSPYRGQRGQKSDWGQRSQSPYGGRRGQSPDPDRGPAPGFFKTQFNRRNGRGGRRPSGRANRGRPNRGPGGDTSLGRSQRGRSPLFGTRTTTRDVYSRGGDTGLERSQRERSPLADNRPTKNFSPQPNTSCPHPETSASLPWGSGVPGASSGTKRKRGGQGHVGGR